MNYEPTTRVSNRDDTLQHWGIKGMKWGIRKLTNSSTPKELSSWMQNNVRYSKFTTLKSPEEVTKSKTGSCHDQVMLELHELKAMGLKPRATFVMEVDSSGKGGVTHSFVHYQDKGKTNWLENAWEGNEGVHEYSNLSEIKKAIKTKHLKGELGDSKKYKELIFSEFGEHQSGESLQELVNKTLSVINTDETLQHWGIKGMKWGKKKTPEELEEERLKKEHKAYSDQLLKTRRSDTRKTILIGNIKLALPAIAAGAVAATTTATLPAVAVGGAVYLGSRAISSRIKKRKARDAVNRLLKRRASRQKRDAYVKKHGNKLHTVGDQRPLTSAPNRNFSNGKTLENQRGTPKVPSYVLPRTAGRTIPETSSRQNDNKPYGAGVQRDRVALPKYSTPRTPGRTTEVMRKKRKSRKTF